MQNANHASDVYKGAKPLKSDSNNDNGDSQLADQLEQESNDERVVKPPSRVRQRKVAPKNAIPKKARSKNTAATQKAARKKATAKKQVVTKAKSQKTFTKKLDGQQSQAEQSVNKEGKFSELSFAKKEFVGSMSHLLGGVKALSSSAIKLATAKTVDSAAKLLQPTPESLERMAKAGRSLRDLRHVAGVSVEEVANAVDLNNPDILKAVEEGKAVLPFELLLRLSSFYARNNPIPFILKYTRTYNPLIASTLEKIGIDKLVITAEREIKFVQILRARDEARALSDQEFQRVYAFMDKAFDMALEFAAQESQVKNPSKGAGK